MNSANAQLIQRAGEAVKAGDRRQAQTLLLQAVRQDARDHVAWMGLARVAPTPQASLDYARRAARLQPNDPLVKKVLAWAEKQVDKSASGQVGGQMGKSTSQPVQTQDNNSRQVGFKWAAYFGTAVLIILLGTAGFWAWDSVNGRLTTTTGTVPTATGAAILAQIDRTLPDSAGKADNVGVTAVPPTATPIPTQNPIQPKNLLTSKAGEPRATWTLTPTPTNTPTPTVTPVPTFVSPNNSQPANRPFGVAAGERWVDVNLSSQTLTAYEGDFAVMSTLISSGLPAWPTVTGQFRVYLRYESQTMDGSRLGYDYYLTGVPYVMYFYQDYALHGTYWHSNFGYPMSHGCVNLETGDAKWLFNFTTIGTVVNVHY